jgi:ribA/ribD-fused uncharacterized protein
VDAAEIRFYRASERPWGAFSNLYRREVEFEGETYATSEHAYQAGKARKPEVRAWLVSAPTPALLAMAAHGLYYWDIAPGWSLTKFDRMRRVLRAKFTQHDDLRALLQSTGDARLVESATVDNEVNRLWGEVNGRGRNMLGELLMELRASLRHEKGSEPVRSAACPSALQDRSGVIGTPLPEQPSGANVTAVLGRKPLTGADAGDHRGKIQPRSRVRSYRQQPVD